MERDGFWIVVVELPEPYPSPVVPEVPAVVPPLPEPEPEPVFEVEPVPVPDPPEEERLPLQQEKILDIFLKFGVAVVILFWVDFGKSLCRPPALVEVQPLCIWEVSGMIHLSLLA